MKKIILILLLSSSCFASDPEPKFHFRDCVKITHGFYKECKGTVESLYETSSYQVYISNCKDAKYFSVYIEEYDLESSKDCEKK